MSSPQIITKASVSGNSLRSDEQSDPKSDQIIIYVTHFSDFCFHRLREYRSSLEVVPYWLNSIVGLRVAGCPGKYIFLKCDVCCTDRFPGPPFFPGFCI